MIGVVDIGGGGYTRTGFARIAFDGQDLVPIPHHQANALVCVSFPVKDPQKAFSLEVRTIRQVATISMALPGEEFGAMAGHSAEELAAECRHPEWEEAIDKALSMALEIASSYHDRGDWPKTPVEKLELAERKKHDSR